MRTLGSRLIALFRKRRLDAELDEEVRLHLDLLAEEFERKGLGRDEARLAARREFGGSEQMKERYRDRRGFPALESLLQDVRYALRLMHLNPGFTAVATVTLALGIGATTAVFTVVNAVLLRRLPMPDAERVTAVQSADLHDVTRTFESAQGVYLDWRDRTKSFEFLAGGRWTNMILSGAGQPHEVRVAAVSHDFFTLIGVQPLVGRVFSREEDQPGRNNVALVDAGFWRRELGGGGGADALGRSITLDDRHYTIVGVLPSGTRFVFPADQDVWVPLAANRGYRTGGDVIAAGRLRAGVTREAAQAEMEAIMAGIRREHQEDSGTGVAVRPLHDWMVARVRRSLLVVLGAVVCVLLICCANIANLMLARATVRQRELAVRASLGAGRMRLMRQALVESVLLAAMGGALGLAFAIIAVRAVPAIRGFYIPRIQDIRIDASMLVFAAAAAILTALLFGVAPAFRASRVDVAAALKQGGAPASASGGRFRSGLVVVQIALAFVLLTGAGLLMNSFARLLAIDLGFQRSHVVTIHTNLPYKKYDQARRREFHRRLMEEVRRLPGVQEVSSADFLALQAVQFPYELRTAGGSTTLDAFARHVAPLYFSVMRIPVLAGREFIPADEMRKPVPILVTRMVARRLFGDENPLGKQLVTRYRDRKILEVVGVAGDVRQLTLTGPPGLQIYVPLGYGNAQNVIARVAPNAPDLTSAIRAAVFALDREVPAPGVSTMDQEFSGQVAEPRFYLGLLGGFAVAGLALAAIGIYGVMSFSVAQRTHEIGVRSALGAGRGRILRLILGSAMRLVVTGAALGFGCAFVLTRLLIAMLYGVRPNDPLTFAAALGVLAAAALGASYLPARRATAADPNIALRCE